MCGCPRHHQSDAPCSCQCPEHLAIRESQIRTALMRYVMRLIDYGKGRPSFDGGATMGQMANEIISIVRGEKLAYPEPTEPGWYAYSGGAQELIFHKDRAGSWRVHHVNGSVAPCTWEYIEQALGVWNLEKIA